MRRKPVYEISYGEEDNYEYTATNSSENSIILASDSLVNLKKEIKLRRWDMGWIQTRNGVFSYGQEIVHTYPYTPKY